MGTGEMTFAEFQESGIRMSVSEGCDLLGIDSDYMGGSNVVALWVYNESVYIEELNDSKFGLLIERGYWEGSKLEIETRLYFEWYVSECVDSSEWSHESLTGLLAAYRQWRNLPAMSADELLAAQTVNPPELRDTATRETVTWLQWFLRVWDDVQMRNDGKGFGGRA